MPLNKETKPNKWYMHKPESFNENETHKIPEIQTDHLILSSVAFIIKKELHLAEFAVPVKNKRKRKYEQIRTCISPKSLKTVKFESGCDTSCIW